MADKLTPEARSRNMGRVPSKNTKPELAVRRAAFAAGFRFRLHTKELPGRPDIVFPRYRIAVFVHGCFWHGHSCRRGARPATNTTFWNEKLDRNAARDRLKLAELQAAQWLTIVIWQCSLEEDTQALLDQLADQRSRELTK